MCTVCVCVCLCSDSEKPQSVSAVPHDTAETLLQLIRVKWCFKRSLFFLFLPKKEAFRKHLNHTLTRIRPERWDGISPSLHKKESVLRHSFLLACVQRDWTTSDSKQSPEWDCSFLATLWHLFFLPTLFPFLSLSPGLLFLTFTPFWLCCTVETGCHVNTISKERE